MVCVIDERLYSKERADKFFDEYSVLIGHSNVLPFYYAKKIFGNKYFDTLEAGKDYNAYDSCSFAEHYLYLDGFRKIVTYYNLDIIKSLVEQ